MYCWRDADSQDHPPGRENDEKLRDPRVKFRVIRTGYVKQITPRELTRSSRGGQSAETEQQERCVANAVIFYALFSFLSRTLLLCAHAAL